MAFAKHERIQSGNPQRRLYFRLLGCCTLGLPSFLARRAKGTLLGLAKVQSGGLLHSLGSRLVHHGFLSHTEPRQLRKLQSLGLCVRCTKDGWLFTSNSVSYIQHTVNA